MKEMVIIKDKVTGATKKIKKSLAGDYIGTGRFTLVEKKEAEPKPKYNFRKEE